MRFHKLQIGLAVLSVSLGSCATGTTQAGRDVASTGAASPPSGITAPSNAPSAPAYCPPALPPSPTSAGLLACSGSPVSFGCDSADGSFSIRTQTGRDEDDDNFDGFITRHDCSQNALTVAGKSLGPSALIGSTYLENQLGMNLYLPGGQKTNSTLYWVIDLSDANSKATGVSEVRLVYTATGTTVYYIKTDGSLAHFSCQ